ncbi:MAG TPA: bifunctional phosphopantothenoylcysteine decarboxylase/phosphopantothenate--cysteine ligase CoaBC [Miltoncostaeaceae bacterium]|nr:bifunctional phosphopantothenoylcysteine decarboxylase/phosphopantothenate--cysteine ligase CoaBC [Miltoncostaeaceae bacterium]
MAEVLLGVTGGVAAYKSIDVLRLLQRGGHGVSVVLTRTAQRFVTPTTFAALSGRPVGLDLFEREQEPGYDHLDHARRADVLLVCPASANAVASMAAGFGADLLGTSFLAFEGPVVVAPAMNTRMWANAATRENVATLERRGVHVIPPASGLLADGDVGVGRLPPPEEIVARVELALAAGSMLRGRRVVVTAGGTQEPIDAVRFVGNRSSGRMGWAVAEEARRRGAEVTVLAANVALPRAPGVDYVETPTAAELEAAVSARLPDADLLVMAAAVADYRPVEARAGKMDKSAADELALRLVRTTDILSAAAAARRPGQVIVGFAAEHGPAGLERARAKRARKGVDVLVHNDVSEDGVGFGSDDNRITIIGPGDAEEALPRMPKRACAARILDALAPLLPPAAAPAGAARAEGSRPPRL